MSQKRIYQIAKELNISHVEILKFLKSKNVVVVNHMAPVDNHIYDSILMEFSKEKASIDRLRKERARQAIIDNKEEVIDSVRDAANEVIIKAKPKVFPCLIITSNVKRLEMLNDNWLIPQ